MRKVVVSEFVSLDGVMEEPAWTAPYWNDEIAEFKGAEDAACDALLLGRVTYEAFAAVWPNVTDPAENPERMNGLPKHVATRTLDTLIWNASPLKDDVVAEIKKLKAQEGKDLLVYGSANFVKTLMEHDLVDQYNLLVYPVVLGKGKRLFADGMDKKLKLVETKTFASGVVALIYEPARET